MKNNYYKLICGGLLTLFLFPMVINAFILVNHTFKINEEENFNLDSPPVISDLTTFSTVNALRINTLRLPLAESFHILLCFKIHGMAKSKPTRQKGIRNTRKI